MLQAMNTGHDGSMTTAHSNSPRDTLARCETMVMMAGMELPVRAIREQVSSAIDLIVHEERLEDGTRKVVNITEVSGMEGDVITMTDIFVFEQSGFEGGKIIGRLRPTGLRPKFMDKIESSGIHLPPSIFGIGERGRSETLPLVKQRSIMGPTTILILGGALALILMVIGLIVTATEEKSLVDDRLEYLEDQGVEVSPKKAVIGEWVGKQATRYTWGQSLTRSLARADIKMKVGEFILVIVILTCLGGFIGWFLGGGSNMGKGETSAQMVMNIPGILMGASSGSLHRYCIFAGSKVEG